MAETVGWRTTEFWLVIGLFVLIALNNKLGLQLNASELLTMAIGVAGYSGSRGLAKLKK